MDLKNKVFNEVIDEDYLFGAEDVKTDGETRLELVPDDKQRVVITVPIDGKHYGQDTIGQDHDILNHVITDGLDILDGPGLEPDPKVSLAELNHPGFDVQAWTRIAEGLDLLPVHNQSNDQDHGDKYQSWSYT